jgi:hypothetical protein
VPSPELVHSEHHVVAAVEFPRAPAGNNSQTYGAPFGASGVAGVGVAGAVAVGWASGEEVVNFGIPCRTYITAATIMRTPIAIGIIGFERIAFPPLRFLDDNAKAEPSTTKSPVGSLRRGSVLMQDLATLAGLAVGTLKGTKNGHHFRASASEGCVGTA